MADDAYLIDKDSVQKIVHAVKKINGEVTKATRPERRRRGGGGKSSSISVFPAVIISGGNGIYLANTLDASGEIINNSVTVIASRATAYDLATDNRIVGVLIPTTTA